MKSDQKNYIFQGLICQKWMDAGTRTEIWDIPGHPC